jgi:diguanylate cyclase (GGDEF)-like protein
MAIEKHPDNPDSRNPLCSAIMQVAHDIRSLLELSAHEDQETWDRFIEEAQRELNEEHFPSGKASDDLLYKTLVSEIYDHLTILVQSLKSSQEKYRHLATRDLLTGLYNRYYFNETIVRDIEKAKREDERLSFIVLDINDFKKINDTFGHLHGDGVLKECAAILKRSVRKSDFLCRYGGDEFVIVTPATECESNDELMGRIRENLDNWNRQYASIGYDLSFSMGCAVWEKGLDLMDVMHEADQAMYEDKRNQ